MTLADMSVSAAICTYNGAGYVREQISSILAQTVPVRDLVIADDGSTDGTLDVVQNVLQGQGDSVIARLTLLQNSDPPLGFVKNFERALQACEGDFVAVADQDDIWESCRIEAAASVLMDHPNIDVVVTDATLIDSDGEVLPGSFLRRNGAPQFRRVEGLERPKVGSLVRRNYFPGMTMMVRRSFLDLALPFPPGWSHDYWISLLSAARGSLAFLPSPLVKYRLHAANTVGVRRSRTGDLTAHGRRVLFGGRPRSAPITGPRDSWLNDGDFERLRLLSLPELRGVVEAKREFERRRQEIARAHVRKVTTVVSLLPAYHRLARNGVLSAIRDIVY